MENNSQKLKDPIASSEQEKKEPGNPFLEKILFICREKLTTLVQEKDDHGITDSMSKVTELTCALVNESDFDFEYFLAHIDNEKLSELNYALDLKKKHNK